jgi:hypothetical protein
MDLKQHRHWRVRPDLERRFTYNGFLTCSECGKIIHTALARRDYYACKGRRTSHTCPTKYMGREKLEAVLDHLFADQLTDARFISQCVETLAARNQQDDSAVRIQRLTAEIKTLREKRSRVVDGFIEGILSREERDLRLATIDHELQVSQQILIRETPPDCLSTKALVDALAPLAEWTYWTRDQKRSVLSALIPDIRVADYRVESLGLKLLPVSIQNTRMDTGSWRPPA